MEHGDSQRKEFHANLRLQHLLQSADIFRPSLKYEDSRYIRIWRHDWFLGALTKLRIKRLLALSCMFVYPHETTRLHVCSSLCPSAWNNSSSCLFVSLSVRMKQLVFISVLPCVRPHETTRPHVCSSLCPPAWNNSSLCLFVPPSVLMKQLVFMSVRPCVHKHETTRLHVCSFLRPSAWNNSSSCLSVPLSASMKQLSSHRTDFLEIRHFSIFRNTVDKIFMLAPCINDKHFIIQQVHKYIIRRYN